MPITTTLRNAIKQIAADAIAPVGATIKCALLKVGTVGTYDAAYGSAYVLGLGGDELPTAAGYTQGGATLANRTAGPTAGAGWVDYDDAVFTAIGALAAIGAVFYDSTNGNRIIGFVDFAGTIIATDDTFTVRLPGDGGNGIVRIG